MSLLNSKDSKSKLTEEEVYMARSHIFAEYIQLNTYESIKQLPQHTSQLSSNRKEFGVNDSIDLDFDKELNQSLNHKLHDVIDLEKPSVVIHEAPAILHASKSKQTQILIEINNEANRAGKV